ncbi:S24 family peptidase [Lysobacter enzymogenes]|uniref:S24 family peptidase n=1 Tax=Lysobacter enzymogenes TaxID=69 RepID=UPI001F6075E2|nr:S24 family peptidase [Lysobacter enzymogenes]
MSADDRPEVALRRRRLKAWIDTHFRGRKADFIRAYGLNQGEISGLLRTKSFGEKRAASLEAATGMPPGYLSAPDGAIADRPKATRVTSSETARDYVRFQLLDGAAGMGDGVENSDYPEVIREVDIAGWEVRRKLGFLPRPGRIKLLTGRGPSMRPMIDNGDVCMVDTEVHAFVGDAVYVINVGGETLIKMLQMRGDGLYVVSANVDYPAYKVDRSELFVGGRVVSVLGMKSV